MSALPRIVVGCTLIILVVLVSERSKTLAGILSTAPINVPIILWILWGQSSGDHIALQVVTRSMLYGILSTGLFIAVCWFGFSRRWSLPHIFVVGYLLWAATVFGLALVRRLWERS